MIRAVCLLAALLSAGCAFSDGPAASQPAMSESLLVVCPSGQLSVADREAASPQLKESLDSIARQVSELHFDPYRSQYHVSPDGRAVVVLRERQIPVADDPAGAWIWPDWRDPSHRIQIPNIQDIQFVSNRTVLVHTAHGRYLVRLSDPGVLHRIPNGWHAVFCSDSGRFISLTWDGKVLCGELDPKLDSPFGRPRPLALDSSAELVRLLDDGNHVVVGTVDGSLCVFDHATGRELSRTAGSIYGTPQYLWSESVIVIRKEKHGPLSRASITPAGSLEVIPLPIGSGEMPFMLSPTTRFFLTHKTVFLDEVRTRVRRMPGVDRSVPTPRYPRGDDLYQGWIMCQ